MHPRAWLLMIPLQQYNESKTRNVSQSLVANASSPTVMVNSLRPETPPREVPKEEIIIILHPLSHLFLGVMPTRETIFEKQRMIKITQIIYARRLPIRESPSSISNSFQVDVFYYIHYGCLIT